MLRSSPLLGPCRSLRPAVRATIAIALAACGTGRPWLLVAVFALAGSIDHQSDRVVAKRLLQLHRSIGILIWCITVVRLGRRLLGAAYVPPLPSDLPTLQRLAARLTHYALYTLLILQPILGILQVRATAQRLNRNNRTRRGEEMSTTFQTVKV